MKLRSLHQHAKSSRNESIKAMSKLPNGLADKKMKEHVCYTYQQARNRFANNF